MGEESRDKMGRRSKWAAFLLTAVLAGTGGSFFAYGETEDSQKEGQKQELQLYAQAAVLMDGDSGRILYGKNETERRAMASTTKIMTCILALEEGEPDQIIEFSKKAASQPEVHLGAASSQSFYLKDLLYSLMLESHNDTAVAIAEGIDGTVEQFAERMNRKAEELGCKNTWFVTPNGLDASSADEKGRERAHSTTAADLARIMQYCIYESPKKEDFLTVTRTASYTFHDMKGAHTYSCNNHNAFLTMMDGALSGKTGFTGEAGYSYVGALERDGKSLIVALLGCGWPPNKTYKWSDTRTLMEYGLDEYEYREVWQERDFPPAKVEGGIPADGNLGETATVPVGIPLDAAERSLKVLMKDGENVSVRYEKKEKLQAPVKEGDEVGTVRYLLEGQECASFPVVALGDVEKITFSWCLDHTIRSDFLFN